MSRKLKNQVYVCGGDYRPGPRDACPDPVHDWPLPSGYCDSFEVAEARLRRRWRNVACDRCNLYGWIPGRIDPNTDHHRPVNTEGGTDMTHAKALADEVIYAHALIGAALALHQPTTVMDGIVICKTCDKGAPTERCHMHQHVPWPCPTYLALRPEDVTPVTTPPIPPAMSEALVNGHTLDCAWFEFAHCDCGYDDADDVLDLFLPEVDTEGAPA